jgi:hypothetical protein
MCADRQQLRAHDFAEFAKRFEIAAVSDALPYFAFDVPFGLIGVVLSIDIKLFSGKPAGGSVAEVQDIPSPRAASGANAMA